MEQWSKRVSSNQDDGTWEMTTGTWFPDSLRIREEGISETPRVRFTGSPITQGAKIESATLTIGVMPPPIGRPVRPSVQFSAFNYDDCPALSTLDWNAPKTPPVNTNLPQGGLWNINVSAQVQAVVNRPGWSPGNSIGFEGITTVDDAIGHLEDFNANPNRAPLLVVQWSETSPLKVKRGSSWEDLGATQHRVGSVWNPLGGTSRI